MTPSFLQHLAVFARRRYRAIFAATLVALGIAGYGISRLALDGDVLNLLPQNDIEVNTYLDTLDAFGTFDYLLVTVGLPEGAAVDPYAEFVEDLAARLEGLDQTEMVEYRIGEPEELLEAFFPACRPLPR